MFINGDSKGFHYGDPLSNNLFILCTFAFSSLPKDAIAKGVGYPPPFGQKS